MGASPQVGQTPPPPLFPLFPFFPGLFPPAFFARLPGARGSAGEGCGPGGLRRLPGGLAPGGPLGAPRAGRGGAAHLGLECQSALTAAEVQGAEVGWISWEVGGAFLQFCSSSGLRLMISEFFSSSCCCFSFSFFSA